MPLPVHVSVLDSEHLALPAARFQRTDDAIVHRRTGPLVLLGVHCQRGIAQRPLFLRSDPAITLGFLLGSDRDTETVERRACQQRRILEPSPVDRATQRTERPVRRRLQKIHAPPVVLDQVVVGGEDVSFELAGRLSAASQRSVSSFSMSLKVSVVVIRANNCFSFLPAYRTPTLNAAFSMPAPAAHVKRTPHRGTGVGWLTKTDDRAYHGRVNLMWP